jgi:hypothetical protein
MATIKLSYDHSQEIREFFNRTQSARDKQEEFDNFLQIISPSLKLKVQEEIFQKSIRNNKIAKFIIKTNN